MYLAVDIGGTKTLLAAFTVKGEVVNKLKFPTPLEYDEFLKQLASNISALGIPDFKSACVAAPGRINREEGIGLFFGNRGWKNFPIGPDLESIANCPVVVENDAKLAGLSEAQLIKEEFRKVLYITVSTGIGIGVVTNGVLDPDFLNSEGGQILLEHDDKLVRWESFASGKAIKEKYGMLASEIDDPETWKTISRNLAVGLVDNLAIIQPDVVVIGGGVGTYFRKFRTPLRYELKKYETPLIPIPPIRQAERSEEAVIYGCYELIKQRIALRP
jgi:predicted NBD/HSP70 family sugar kinase